MFTVENNQIWKIIEKLSRTLLVLAQEKPQITALPEGSALFLGQH